MATLTVESLDDRTYSELELRAQANKRSVEAEVRAILETQLWGTTSIAAKLAARRQRIQIEHGLQTDSVDLIRTMRDEV